jgi:AcrR family transcriptional regulator
MKNYIKPNGRFMKNTKEHILEIALGLFLEKSFKEVTMNDIVKKTGMSKGAFYHYFSSKEDLFREILQNFLSMTSIDYSSFSKESLAQFKTDYVAELEKRIQLSQKAKENSLKNANYFFMIFDGLKLFPEIRKQTHDSLEIEVNAWKRIVAIARKSGEIRSKMADEQIAKMFVFISDGIGMRLMVENKLDQMTHEIVTIWDGLYKQLKA